MGENNPPASPVLWLQESRKQKSDKTVGTDDAIEAKV